MLNNLLQNQITQYLGDKPVLSPAMTALFDAIDKVYMDMENKNNEISIALEEKKLLLTETKDNFLAMTTLFHQTGLTLQKITKRVLDDSKYAAETETTDPTNIIKLADSLNYEINLFIEKHQIQSAKLQELENINKELDQFAYIVSHDLKAPLRAISNLSQWIEDDITHLMNNQSKENFRLLRSRVYRMESLINAILTYSKSTKSKNKTELSDTGWLLHEVIDSLNCPENITISIQGKFPVIDTESIKLQQVFANLISNSIKYNDKSTGEIEIGYFETEEFCQFYVKDNGPGIEPQYHKKVFQIFQTLEAKDEYESTGIGLAIVKKIIEEKGGKIWIESEKGLGAKFVFLWPKVKTEILQNL